MEKTCAAEKNRTNMWVEKNGEKRGKYSEQKGAL